MAESALAERSALRRRVAGLTGDSLYRNSSFLLLNSVLISAIGFVFWTLAARHSSSDVVGTTTTVISAVTYAGMMGTLGLPNTVIRFLAGAPDPARMIATAGAVAAGAGAAVGAVWLLVPGHLGFPLHEVAPRWWGVPLVVSVVALASLGAVAEAAIIALRQSKWVVVENGVASLVRLAVLPVAIGFGAAGLFGLFAAGLLASTVASAMVLAHVLDVGRGRIVAGLDLGELRRVRSFAATNHLAALVSMLPGTVVRIVVLARLGASAAAFLAMPLLIVAILKFIPSTASQSLFAEVASDESSVGRQARRALRGIYAVLLPAVVVLVVAAHPVLSVFGRDYAEAGTNALRLLALSGVFAGFNYVADTVLNAHRRMADYLFVNIVGSACAIGFPLAFVDRGLTGVGFGWLLGQFGYAVVAAGALWHRRRPLTPAGGADAEVGAAS